MSLRQGRVRAVDVAKLAGVSSKTVSNVVNGYLHVSADVRARVTTAIQQLDYVPNSSGRTLRTGRTGIIALALPDLAAPYFAELASGIAGVADQQQYTILVDQTDGRLDRERLVAGGLRLQAIDGLIFSPLAMTADEIAVAAGNTPMVLLGEREHPASLDHIAIDNTAAARCATEHLISLGRNKIALIGDSIDTQRGTGGLRAEGYRSALRAAGLPIDPELIISADRLERETGIIAAQALFALPDPPDAVFCCNDLVALGVLHVAREHGLSVPGDVAVVGVDDIEEGRYSLPALSTIAPDKNGIAREAVALLLRRMRGDRSAPGVEVRPRWRLEVRASSQL